MSVTKPSLVASPAASTPAPVLGLDLRSGPRYPTGLAVLDASRRLRALAIVRTDEEIEATVARWRPALIAIDAPLGLPEGRCCADPTCDCARFGIYREIDRICARLGYRPFPSLLPSMVKLTLRGAALCERLLAAGERVVEVYPGMVQDILGIPRKQAGLEGLTRGLRRAGVRGIPRARRVTHDELDAATCALAALLHLEGRARLLGPGVPVPFIAPLTPTEVAPSSGCSEYNRLMATPEDINDLLAKMDEERTAFLSGAGNLTEEAAEVRRPDQDGEAGWSPKEQFSHLAETELSYLVTAQRAVTGGDVEQQRPRYPLAQAHSGTVAQHLEELNRLRDQTINYIHFLTPEEFDARVISGAFPEMSVLQWLRSYYRHDRMHLAQIEGRPSDYQPRFVGGEPDQRRRG